ncbi:MAG TPA: DUF2184 domain-containing protein [Steroidobacteraceae bacterium]|nr:DUF2184 domain-containing protein [Steroidobacteraceae bacterium]
MSRNNLAFDSKLLTDAVRNGLQATLFRELAEQHGICFDASLAPPGGEIFDLRGDGGMPLTSALKFVEMQGRGARPRFVDPSMAMDVQSELVTVQNAGIPWFLANWIDPKLIPVLVSPMMAAQIAGEALKGDWLTETAMFLVAEAAGETSAYGDYSNAGASNANVNYPQRQNFLFQCFMQYGQRELGRMGLAKVDWASQQQQANALTLMKALNYLYFYGASGLENYGLINDPYLSPSLTATYAWLTNANANANTIYQDVVRLFIQLQTQSNGTIRMDDPMVLTMSPAQSVALTYITQYNTNSVKVLLKENFPNLRIETAPEYGPPYNLSGQLVTLFAEQLEGQRTVECAFSVKLLAHNMVVESSSWRQKRTSGGYGSIWYRRFAQVSMLA